MQLVEEVQTLTDAPAAVLLTRVVKRTVAAAQIRDALASYELPVLDAEVPQAQALAMSYGSGIESTPAYTAVLAELKELLK